MARTTAQISVGADTRQLERDIQNALAKDFKFKGLNEKAFTQPLGRITGASNEFQKSLDASNARVIAFGASAGAIFAVERAFVDLIKSAIDVEKSLTDINIILNTTAKGLEQFGGQLFDVAKNTSQSFQTVAQAATELARQGLGAEETLKRTRDALILTRLSGLDTVSSVEALTAVLNSFTKTALDSTTVINKLANVDAAFAVSSADLAQAVQRVGSSAQDAGVSFDELLAIVTSVQQTTARGGAVIGNSLKTIFTRIQRTDVLDQLESLGLEVRNLDGSTRPALSVLQELATRFDTLSDAQRSQIAESVGGVFQINVLKAALGDLGKEYSIYNNALQTSVSATDEAIQRNEALNETLSALINRTLINFTQLGAKIGAGAFQPAIQSTLQNVNNILESIAEQDTESVGAKIGRGILGGLSTFISGPGLLLVTAVLGKLFLDLTKFAASSAKTLLGIGKQAEQRAQIEGKISAILAQEPQLLAAINAKQISVLDVENKILTILREQNTLRQQAATLSTSITAGLIGRGVSTKGGQITTKSGGFIPNYVMEEIYGALSGGYMPGKIKEMNIPGIGRTIYNSAEKVKRLPGFDQPAIMPPQGSQAGRNYKESFSSRYGFNPYASAGLIPNFKDIFMIEAADGTLRNYSTAQIPGKIRTGEISEAAARKAGYKPSGEKIEEGKTKRRSIKEEGFYDTRGTIGIISVKASGQNATVSTGLDQLKAFQGAITRNPELAKRKVTFGNIQIRSLEGDLDDRPSEFSRLVNESILDPIANITQKYLGSVLREEYASPNALADVRQALQGKRLLPSTAEGSIFETAVNLATKTPKQFIKSIDDEEQRPFDFEESGPATANFKKRFKFGDQLLRADAKLSGSGPQIRSVIKKAYNSRSFPDLPYSEYLYNGLIPNFAALEEAINRELQAGVNPNQIKVGNNRLLKSSQNPLGLGVYNTKDEPRGLAQGISRYNSLNQARKAGASAGLIPNFAIYSAAQGETGPILVKAAKEAETELVNLVKSVKAGALSLDQASAKLKEITKKFDIAEPSLGRLDNTVKKASISGEKYVRELDKLVAQSGRLFSGNAAVQELQRRADQGGARGELARQKLEEARNRRDRLGSRLQGIGIGASIGVPILSSITQEFAPNNRGIQAGTTAVGDIAAFAGTGAFFGPAGIAIGGLIGATIGLTKAFKILQDRSEEFARSSQESANRVSRFSEDVQALLTSREKITGIETGTIQGGPTDLAKLAAQRDSALARIYTSLGEESKAREQLVKAFTSGGEQDLQAALQRAQEEIASSNFAAQFIQFANEQLTKNKDKLDFSDILKQFSGIRTKGGQYIGDLLVQQDDLLDSFAVLSNVSEKYYGLNTQLADSISSAAIATDKANLSIEEFARNDLFGFDTTSVLAGIKNQPIGFGSTLTAQFQQTNSNLGGTAKLVNETAELYRKNLGDALEDSATKLRKFINELGKSDEGLDPTKAKELADTISNVILNPSIDLEERARVLQKTFGDLKDASQVFRKEAERVADILLNLSNLTSKTAQLFDGDVERRKEAAQFIQKGDFGRLVKDYVELNPQFKPQNVLIGQNAAALQAILGGTADAERRVELERKFGEAYKKAASEIAETGILTDRTLAELNIAVQNVGTEASMNVKNMTDLGLAIGDTTLRTEALNAYTAKESELKRELGDNIVKLNYASLAAADSLKAIAGFKEGTLFADEYKRLQDLARENRIRAGQGNVGDIFSSFSDEMTYGSQDAFRDLNAIGSDTARTLKSEFNNAFQSIIDGTSEVGDAFRTMALNISRRIQQLALEMTTNLLFNSLFSSIGGIPSVFRNPLGRAKGGYVQGFSTGGKVMGGSGTKDDVPAMLTKGEYVIKKSSVNKYGADFLERLNNGGVVGLADGGSVDEDLIAQYLRDSIKMPASESDPGRVIDKALRDTLVQSLQTIYESKDLTYSDAFSQLLTSRTPSGGSFRGNLAAIYTYDGKYPSGGTYLVDPLLSQMALFDENDPQNQINQENRNRLTSYLAEGIDIYERNKEAIIETIQRNREEKARVDQLNQQQQDAFEKQQRNALIGAFIQAGVGVGAGMFSTYGVPFIQKNNPFLAGNAFGSQTVRRATAANPVGDWNVNPYQYARYVKDGGFIGYANGGQIGKDNIPAMLMGGEYVMRKDSVNMYGRKFFDDLNAGRIRGYANGGMVGGDSGETYNESKSSVNNNINISINMTNNGQTNESSTSNQDGQERDRDEQKRDLDKAKELTERIKTEVVKVINQEQRPGGLLSSSVYAMAS